MLGDLTTLANVKAWAQINATAEDAMISRLVTSASQVIRNYCRRALFLSATYTESYDGTGDVTQMLRQWPVTSVASLSVNMAAIPAITATSWNGFAFDQWDGFSPGSMCALKLRGHRFWEGQGNVTVTYQAGYLVSGEAATVPATGFQVTPLSPYGMCTADAGVTYANGTALTAIASGTPAVGQYVPPSPMAATSPVSYYQFAAADASNGVVLSYSYIPADLEFAACELVAERLKYKGRIGFRSQSSGAGGENTSYIITDLTPYQRMALQPYRTVIAV